MIPALPLLLSPLLVQAPAAEDAPGFQLPAGLEVTTWADSPLLFNPTAIDVDAKGRVWVAEAVNYRKWGGRNPGREHPEGDRIVVLEDQDGDGIGETSRVFVQDPDLTAPLGIAVIGSQVFVSCSPNLFVYTDADGDLVPEKRETLLTGFGGFDHDHGLHSVVGGPDGRLYIAVGNAGPHMVTDGDGWSLRSGSLYRGGGPATADNKPGLVSDDGHAWTGGLVLAMEPDGTGLEVLAHNFRNNYEVAVDAWGEMYQADNDDDGNQGCRTLWCLPYGNHGFFSADGARSWQADRRPGQDTQRAHWHQDDPGVAPAGCINGAGGPTGVAMYEAELLADWFDGAVLNCDAGAGVVYAHRPQQVGAGFELAPGDALRRARGDGMFRPSDVAVGMDGAIYVSDWYDPGVGGHAARDREARGRILRIVPEGQNPPSATVDLSTAPGCLEALDAPAVNVRYQAQLALGAMGAEARDALAAAWRDPRADARRRARLAWLVMGPAGDEELRREVLRSEDGHLRTIALRAARTAGSLTGDLLVRMAEDEDPSVRREVALSLRGMELGQSLFALLELAQSLDPTDRYMVEAFGLAAEGHEEALFAELSAEQGDLPPRWSQRFRTLAWRLHPAAAVSGWMDRAMDPGLPVEARREALDALAFTPDRSAAEAMLTLAQAGPEDLRGHAAYWIRHRDTNDWRDLDLARQLGAEGELASAESLFASDVLTDGSVDIDVDVTGASVLWLVVEDGGDGHGCDWADWIEPVIDVDGETVSLAERDWMEAETGWGQLRRDANCGGGPLAIGDESGLKGIGTHAPSRIAWALPEGATRMRVRAGVDRGGVDQGCGNSVRFRVLVNRPEAEGPGPDALMAARLADVTASFEERLEAADRLARDPRGALRLIRLASQEELDPRFSPTISAAIYSNPDVAVRALASEHFPRPGQGESQLPSIAELLELEGDVHRGREVFLDVERSQCFTCHAFTLGDSTRGGDIGPDLTQIGSKYDRAQLLDSILNPSAGIAFGYDSWLIEMTDGEVFSGFVLADGADVVLKDTRGERYVLAADEIATRVKQTISTMPEGVALGLDAQDLADLVAFLDAPQEEEPTFGEEIVLFDGTSMDGWTYHLTDGSLEMSDVWTVEDGQIHCQGRPAGYIRTEAEYTSFLLTLEWRFDPESGAGNSGVLLRQVGQDKVWPKSIEAQLQHRSAGDIWNIDRFPMETASERTRGRHTSRAQPSSERPIGEWNRYEILLDGPRLELRVNGELQNTADWCEVVPGHICLQSEGARIFFRDIRLTPIID